MRKTVRRWARPLSRDDGVAGLIIAMIIAIVAATTLAIYLSGQFGPTRNLERLQSANQAAGEVRAALFAYMQQQSPAALPCPDTDQDGDEDCTDSTGTASGTLPWTTMGMSREAVIDPYGRFYTYVVLAGTAPRQVCTSVENNYEAGEIEYTGELKDQTTLEVRLTSQSSGEGTYVPFALISHGANGLGGISSTGTTMAAPVASSYEETNAEDAGPTVVYSGPANSTAGTTYFDDVVVAPSIAQLQAVCENLSPGEAMNASLSEDFNSATSIDTDKFTTTGSGTPPTIVSGQAQFTATTSFLATSASYDFNSTVRPVYVAAYWTPSASPGGMSIATRATLSPTGNAFTTGLTFQFYSTGTTGANTIRIFNDDGTDTNSGADTYTFTAGEQYLIEAYDNGTDVWGRISQVSTPSNSAELSVSSVTSDRGGTRRSCS